MTRAGFRSIVIGWLGPGSLIDLVSIALVLPAVDVNECDLFWDERSLKVTTQSCRH